MTTITLPRAVVEQALGALKYFRNTAICSADTEAASEVIPNLEAALAQQAEPVATVTECEACFTPDVCQLRGTCDYYTASQMRIAAPPQRKPLTQEEIAAEWRKASECAGKSEGAVTTSQFVEMFARGVEAKHGIKESP